MTEISQQVSVSRQPGSAFWFRWVVASIMAGVVGCVLAVIIAFATAGIGVFGMGGAVAAVLGTFQGRLLERSMPRRLRSPSNWGNPLLRTLFPEASNHEAFRPVWTAVTTWGGFIGSLLFLGSSIAMSFLLHTGSKYEISVITTLFGGLLGILYLARTQWGVLRWYIQAAAWWFPANVLGWCLGWLSAALLAGPWWWASFPTEDGNAVGIIAILFFPAVIWTMLIHSAITGCALIWLLRRSDA